MKNLAISYLELVVIAYFFIFVGCILGATSTMSLAEILSVFSTIAALIVAYVSIKGLGIYKKQASFQVGVDAAKEVAKSRLDSKAMSFGIVASRYADIYKVINESFVVSNDQKIKAIDDLKSLKAQAEQFNSDLAELKPIIYLHKNNSLLKTKYAAIQGWRQRINEVLFVSNFLLQTLGDDPVRCYDEIKLSLSEFINSENESIGNLFRSVIKNGAWNSIYEEGFAMAEELIKEACKLNHHE